MSSRSLASAVEWLDQRILSDPSMRPELFARLTVAQRELGLLHDARPVCPFLRPHLLSRSQYNAIAEAAETLAGAFERVADAALSDEGLLSELDLKEREARMARFDPGYPWLCVTSRLDTFLCGDDFRFLEYNAESPAGVGDQMQLEKVLFQLPHMREFLDQYAHLRLEPHRVLLNSLVECYRKWGGEEEHPHIAITDWKGVPTEAEFHILRNFFESEGYSTTLADPRDFEYDGDTLTLDGFRVDILYKRVIIHEFLEKFDETHPMARAYADHRVCMANSFRTKLVHKKASLAILSDPQYEHLFTPEQISHIRRHIPWTRRVREGNTTFEGGEDDLLTILKRERERLVLKPNDDYGGHGIFIGWETEPDEWEQAIKLALAQSYIVQERVPVRKVSLPMFAGERLVAEEMLVDFDPFLFLNRVEGGLVRLSSSSLCNVTSGGGETALLVLEDF